tara:strand:+ start:5819 stop:6610 length:792 start_codon:yes stop_codon:yes gene_type:complete
MAKLKLDDIEEPTQPTQQLEPEEIIPAGYFPIETLPSKFKLYPKGTKIYSRPLKILEVKQLSMIDESNFNSVINTVLSKTVKGIDIQDLVVADKLFIIFWQRANTYKGDAFSIDLDCDKCGSKVKYNFDVSQLVITDVSDDYDADKIFTLPECKATVKFEQMTVKSEKNADSYLKGNKGADDDMVAIAAVLTSIDDKPCSIDYKYKWLIDLSVADIMFLTHVYHKEEISLNPMLEIECPSCGGKAETPISFRADFFLPEYKTQ